MPIDFQYIPEHLLVITRFHGVVTDDDLESTYREIFNHPDTEPGFIELALHDTDFCPEVTEAGLRKQIQLTNQFHGTTGVRSAAVVGKLQHEAMLGYVQSNINAFPDASEKMEMFTSIYDALEYLGVDPSSIPLANYSRFDFDHHLTYEELRQQLRDAQRERDEMVALYKALFEHSNAIAVFDIQVGIICQFNNQFCQLIGYQREEIPTLNIWDFDIQYTEAAVKQSIKAVTREGSAVFETQYKTKQGIIKDILLHLLHVRVNSRDYIQAINIDISERKEQERLLAKRNQEIELTLTGTNCGTWQHDFTSGIIYYDPRAQNILGFPSSETTFGEWMDKIHPGDKDTILETIQSGFAANEPRINATCRFIRGDQVIYIKVDTLIQYSDGQPIITYGLVQDVTDYALAKERLELSQKKYRRLIDNLGDRFVVFSQKFYSGELLYLSSGFESVFGIPVSFALNKRFATVINWCPGELERAATHHQALAIGDRKFQHDEYSFIHPDGKKRYITITSHLTRDETGIFVREGIIGNTTQRKQEEQELAEKNIELSTTLQKLATALIEKTQAEQKLSHQNELLDTIGRLQSSFIDEEDPQSVFDTMLLDVLRLTKSQYGFVDSLERDNEGKPYLQTLAISNIAWDKSTHEFYDKMASHRMRFYYFYDLSVLFGPAVTNGEVVISNYGPNNSSRKGIPLGHPSLDTFLAVPLLEDGKIIGVIGLANREGGYTEELVQELEVVWSSCTQLVNAYKNRLEKIRAEKKLAETNQELSAKNIELSTALQRLATTLVEKTQTEHQLFYQNELLDTIYRLQSLFIGKENAQSVFDTMLLDVLRLTKSQYGFVESLERDREGKPYLQAFAISNMDSDNATSEFYNNMAPHRMRFYDFRALFGPAITNGEVVISNYNPNDPRRKGTPLGDLSLDTFLAVPLLEDGKIIGVIGLANREGGYTKELVEGLEAIWSSCTQLVNAYKNRLEKIRAEQKLAERNEELSFALEELEKSKNKLQSYADILDKYVITSSTDNAGIITKVSDAFCQVFGYSRCELIGSSEHMIKHPSIPESFYEEIQQTIESEGVWNGEILNRRKDSEDCWVDAYIEEIKNESGEIVGYTTIKQDITDKKRNEILSVTDPLTHLCNRLKLDSVLALEVQRCQRYGAPLSLIMLDVDHFKKVNDTHGHQVGDLVLTNIATLLDSNCRKVDTVGRWGGEEFLIVCPETNSTGAVALAEKIRALIIGHEFPIVKSISASFGVATYQLGEMADQVLGRADAALYRAKENGRNRVEMASTSSIPEKSVKDSLG